MRNPLRLRDRRGLSEPPTQPIRVKTAGTRESGSEAEAEAKGWGGQCSAQEESLAVTRSHSLRILL